MMSKGTIIAAGHYLTESERKRLAKQIDAEIAPLVEALETQRAWLDSIAAAIAKAKQEERT